MRFCGLRYVPWLFILAGFCLQADAQQNLAAEDGEALYETHCSVCHADPDQDPRMPRRAALAGFSPNHIVAALTDGLMSMQGAALQPEQRIAVAGFLTGREYAERDVVVRQGMCEAVEPLDLASTQQWNGWGADLHNTRFQSEQ